MYSFLMPTSAAKAVQTATLQPIIEQVEHRIHALDQTRPDGIMSVTSLQVMELKWILALLKQGSRA